jgi:hypothetical protein
MGLFQEVAMNEMVERVASAMCDTKLWPGAWETEGNREEWRMLARAAIEAMREPRRLWQSRSVGHSPSS